MLSPASGGEGRIQLGAALKLESPSGAQGCPWDPLCRATLSLSTRLLLLLSSIVLLLVCSREAVSETISCFYSCFNLQSLNFQVVV